MARLDYSTYVKKESNQNYGDKDYKVSFFALKDDGDEAVVRFAYDSVEDFHIATVHAVEVEGKQRRVSCLRTGTEPLSKCPLCGAGHRVYDKMFVKIIQYTTDASGHVQLQARIWERPAYFSKTLENYLKEYGPLRDNVFKIKRRGKKGDTKTTYDILYANPAIYKESIYVKNFTDFDDFEINKFFYTEKTADEMRIFLTTEKFPEKQKTATSTIAPAVPTSSQPVVPQTQTGGYVQQTTTGAPVQSTVTTTSYEVQTPESTTQSNQSAESDPTSQRPRRYTY